MAEIVGEPEAVTSDPPQSSGRGPRRGPLARVYRGENDIDFPRLYRVFVAVSVGLVLASLVSVFTRGLNLAIDFEGGSVWEVPSESLTVAQATDVLAKFDKADGSKVQEVRDASGTRILRVQAEVTEKGASDEVTDALATAAKVKPAEIDTSFVGPSWGKTITRQALKALVVFLVLVFLFISLRLEWRMAVAAIVAVAHDVLITVGVYSLFQFEVTPATVISFLTILGYSLYDTIVVFDRVQENGERLAKTGRYTYTAIMRRSLNQVLMRSVNTTLISLLPVISMMVVGAGIFGQTTLRDFSLALFIGLMSGAYSSLAVAAPVVVWLKERESSFARIRSRLLDRGVDVSDTSWKDGFGRANRPPRTAVPSTAETTTGEGGTAVAAAIRAKADLYERAHPPRPRKGRR